MATDASRPAGADAPRPNAAPVSLGPAWQPLTWRGVASFSRAPLSRLFIVQLVVALLVTATVLWFLHATWFVLAREAVGHLPDTGQIANQHLETPLTASATLVEHRLLTMVVDVKGTGSPRLTTDLRVEFRTNQVRVCSLLGCGWWHYPSGQTLQFNRPELESWWGAWEAMIHAVAGLSVLLGLFISWLLLATFYCPFLRLYAFFKDRRLTLGGSWKLAAASLLPAALILSGALVLYGLGLIDLVRLLIVWLLHFVVSWVYLLLSTLRLPPTGDALPSPRGNPFDDPEEPSPNPFAATEGKSTLSDRPEARRAG